MEDNKELYNEYEELLMKRDQMYKEADSYQIGYNREFGDLITRNFELKIECIRRKKTIAACMRRINRGLVIDVSEMMKDIEKEMTAYYIRLKDMNKEIAGAKDAEPVDGYNVSRSKKIYRRIAKRIHPDVNKKTRENDDIEDKIERLELKIHDIATTEPYIYGELLADEEKKTAFKEALEEEKADYENYIRQLDGELEKLIGKEKNDFFACSVV